MARNLLAQAWQRDAEKKADHIAREARARRRSRAAKPKRG